MSEMVERVARALEAQPRYSIGRRPDCDGWFILADNGVCVSDYCETLHAAQTFIKHLGARAAINAMREPTEAMIAAGNEARDRMHERVAEMRGPEMGDWVQSDSSVHWRAMIDAALK